MTTTNNEETRRLSGWTGQELLDKNGEKIGKIDAIYADEQTGKPEWLGVTTGIFGTHVSFVPVVSVNRRGEQLSVPYTKDHVKDAPRVDPDEVVSEQEEGQLYRHYQLTYSDSRSETGLPEESTDDAMTRSEEELWVRKRPQPTERVRLRKWVETEQVQQTVPVRREKARIEREPITDDNIDQAMSGPEISGGEHEVVLSEEQVVTDKQVVPKERVRLTKDQEIEEVEVADEIRKERIGVEGESASRK